MKIQFYIAKNLLSIIIIIKIPYDRVQCKMAANLSFFSFELFIFRMAGVPYEERK
jgi:uncharacterized membrane protein YccF (DUF307 family)